MSLAGISVSALLGSSFCNFTPGEVSDLNDIIFKGIIIKVILTPSHVLRIRVHCEPILGLFGKENIIRDSGSSPTLAAIGPF